VFPSLRGSRSLREITILHHLRPSAFSCGFELSCDMKEPLPSRGQALVAACSVTSQCCHYSRFWTGRPGIPGGGYRWRSVSQFVRPAMAAPIRVALSTVTIS